MIYSQEKPVLPHSSIIIDDYRKFEQEIPASDKIEYDKNIDIFVYLKNYNVIDESTIKLEIEIQKLQLSGFKLEEKKKIKKYPGTNLIITEDVPETDPLSGLIVNLINSETGKIIYSAKENLKIDLNELVKLTEDLSNKIVEINQIWDLSLYINEEITEVSFIGKPSNSKYLIMGNLGKFDQQYSLSFSLKNFLTGVLVSQITGKLDFTVNELLKQTVDSFDEKDDEKQKREGTGSIYVFSDREMSDVFLNGDLIGKTPLLIENIEKGDHVVEVKNGNYYYNETISVIEGRIAGINAELMVLKGLLFVETFPDEFDIFIDSSFYGRTPKLIDNIDAGSHLLTLEKEWYGKIEEKIEILPDEKVIVNKKVKETGRLFIEILNNLSEVDNLTISKGNDIRSISIESEGSEIYRELPEGNYLVSVKGGNIKTLDEEIFVESGKSAILQVYPEYNLEYIKRLEEKNNAIVTLENMKRKRDIYNKAGYITAGGSILSTSSFILFYVLAKDQLEKYNTYYSKYEQASTTEEAMVYRDISQDHYDNGKRFRAAEYISLGVAVLSAGASVFFFLRKPKDTEINDIEFKINTFGKNDYKLEGYIIKKF
jgi:hypothetical protein